jgi:hypothetical protein
VEEREIRQMAKGKRVPLHVLLETLRKPYCFSIKRVYPLSISIFGKYISFPACVI